MMIRPMTEKDVDAVAALEKQCFSVPWMRQDFENCVSSPLYHYLIAEGKTGKILAYGGIQQMFDEADVENIAVAPGYRKKGIARELLHQLLQDGKENGVKTFFLEVRESNFPAIELYLSLGFKRLSERKKYYPDGETAIVMIKEIEK